MAAKQDQSWVTEGLQRPSQRFRPVDDSYVKVDRQREVSGSTRPYSPLRLSHILVQPPLKQPPTTAVTSNLEGARTDPELNKALLNHRDETVGASLLFTITCISDPMQEQEEHLFQGRINAESWQLGSSR